MWFVKVSHYFFLLNAFLSPANENGVWIKSWYWLKSILYSGLWFQNGCNKVTTDLLVRQFWFKTIPVIWNLTRAKCLFEVEITQMISDQTAFHSVNCHIIYYLIKSILLYNKPIVNAKLQYNIWNSPTCSTLDRMIGLGLNVCSLTVSFMPGRLHPERFFLIIDWLCRIPLVILVAFSFLVRSDALNL